jgi:hypothetical protein
MNRYSYVVLAGALCVAGLASADVKITANYNTDGKSSETTIYANGSRLRYDYGKGLVLLRQCDVNRIVQVDDKARTYLILPAEQPAVIEASSQQGSAAPKVEVTDTKERKDMFGYTARHLKVTDVIEGNHGRTETDGWYIDLKDVGTCSRQEIQSAADGYPVAYTITIYEENGKASSTVIMRVTSLLTAPLDAALFEVPRGYTETTPQNVVTKAAPKAPGVTRVGAVTINNQAAQKIQSTTAYNQLLAQLQSAQLDVVPLTGETPDAVQQKAREADCDYVLYTDLAAIDKPQSGKIGGFLHKAPGIGHMTGGDALEARVSYRLVPAGGGSPVLSSTITGKTGGSFDWKSAALLASNVFPMTMAARMMGGAFNPAMMSALLNGRGSGATMMSMDPMMSSLTMLLRATNGSGGLMGGPAGPAQNPAAAEAALAAALDQEAKAIITQLKSSPK